MDEIDKKVQNFVIKNAKDYDYSNDDSASQILRSLKKVFPKLVEEESDNVNESTKKRIQKISGLLKK